MELKQVRLVYFSPTGTTRKVLEGIAQGIDVEDVEHIDLTLPEGARQTIPRFTDELVIMGAPVYGGRLPVEAVKRFKQLRAGQTPAILLVVYGNREFEDALLELKNLALEQGFIPLAGGAFIGEHSFAAKDVPIAMGRPDSLDVQAARAWGVDIKQKVNKLELSGTARDLEVPGRFPHEAKGARPMAVSPVTREDACLVCGTCASVCPTAAISINDGVSTNIELCIRCCACVKNCPTGSRVMEDRQLKKIAAWLYENCGERKEPQIFWLDD